MNKTKIKNFSIWARRYLLDTIAYRMRLLGIDEKGIAEEMSGSTDKLKLYNMGTSKPVEVLEDDIPKRVKLANEIISREQKSDYKTAYETIVDEIAYTWFNRLIAIRFMEVNDYLPSGVRVLSSQSGKNEPDIVTNAEQVAEEQEFPITKEEIWKYKDSQKLDDLYRVLFFMQCKKLNTFLPELFSNSLDDYTEILLPISFTDSDGFIRHLVSDIDEADFDLTQQGQVEIIGWLYQYYNSEKKDAVFAAMNNKVKVSKENIPAATQLFTPDWIVRYMVENSLGRLWTDGHPDTSAKSEWKYYLEEAEQTEEVNAQLTEIRESRKTLTPEQIRFIDPCMGSGHILIYAFDVLMQIYLSCGYTERDAAQSIVRNNLWGLDLDKRAYQLAYFAVMMKARQYDRRFMTRKIVPNLSHFQDLPNGSTAHLQEPIKSFVEQFKDADTYGSLLTVTADDKLDEALDGYIGTLEYNAGHIEHLMRLYKALSQKYDVVCTNPPYMSSDSMNNTLMEFVFKNYPEGKYDLFACFIDRCKLLSKYNGYYAMITQQVWMFNSRYVEFRKKHLSEITVNLIHLGARAFDEISGEIVQTVAFINQTNTISDYTGTYIRLIDVNGEINKEKQFLSGKNQFYIKKNKFSQIPSSPYSYWLSDNFLSTFSFASMKDVIFPKQGTSTGADDIYVRFWYEIDISKFSCNQTSLEQALTSGFTYFPLDKGSKINSSMKWFGSNEKVIKMNQLSYNRLLQLGNHLPSRDLYFKAGITWAKISGSDTAFRYDAAGFVFSSVGLKAFPSEKNVYYALGLLNSAVITPYLKALSPGLSTVSGDIEKIPVIFSNNINIESRINNFVKENIDICKKNWDSFETSWDFDMHPFVKWSHDLWDATAIAANMHYFYGELPKVSCPLELCFMLWQGECNERRNKLKENEEELNRIFIDIYGLQDELTPDVADEDITVRKADVQRDVKSFISYAVGCMFGRYSLDVDGLAYAGGEWDDTKYNTYIPDKDNCIPITDEYFFEDDIVTRFEGFVKAVYGEDSLEDNLRFIADNIGIKGSGTAREKIRQYFLKDFFKDHCKTYQKRPIYWLFDTGKKNGFKALCYVHRWNADTPGNVRIDYMHKLQRLYRNEILRLQENIDNGEDVAKSQKRLEKITTQLKETEEYDAKIGIVVAARTEIDLDDGVKVNYEKVQTGTDGKHYDILAKI